MTNSLQMILICELQPMTGQKMMISDHGLQRGFFGLIYTHYGCRNSKVMAMRPKKGPKLIIIVIVVLWLNLCNNKDQI